jgi:hypothetical protein
MRPKTAPSFKFEKPPEEVGKALKFLDGNFFAQDPQKRHQARVVVLKEQLLRLFTVAHYYSINLETDDASNLELALTLAADHIRNFDLRSKRKGNPRNVVTEHALLLTDIKREMSKGVNASQAFRNVCKKGRAGDGRTPSQVSSIYYRVRNRCRVERTVALEKSAT